MAVRAFLVALVLIGQLPVRACTCGEADHDPPAAGHHHDDPDAPPDGDRHHPDCPAGDPRAVLAEARPAPTAAAHADHAPLPAGPHPLEPAAPTLRVTPGCHPPRPAPPFSRLRVLRI